MQSRFLLETSVIIEHLKGSKKGSLLQNLSGELYSSVICFAEIYEGILHLPADKQKKAKLHLNNFFYSLDGILTIDHKVAQRFSEIRAELRNKGKLIGDLDILIAATAIENNLTLITLNKRHFGRIKELKILLG